jgi:hypothetical protein
LITLTPQLLDIVLASASVPEKWRRRLRHFLLPPPQQITMDIELAGDLGDRPPLE